MTDRVAELELARLDAGAAASFDTLFSIYSEALPKREQKSRAELLRMLADPAYRFFVASNESAVIGFAIVYVFPALDGALLEYMAIDRERRGRGLGAELFRATAAAVDLPLVLEVDAVEAGAGDNEVRRRRQAFYRRLGCRRVRGLAYVLPLPGPGPPPHMNLMIHGASSFELGRDHLRTWLKLVYTRVYHCRPDDPRLPAMLAGAMDPVSLE